MLTLSEAAEQLGISRAALDNWIKRLEIEKKKEGRIGLTAKEVEQIRKQRRSNSRRRDTNTTATNSSGVASAFVEQELKELKQVREQLQGLSEERLQWQKERLQYLGREASHDRPRELGAVVGQLGGSSQGAGCNPPTRGKTKGGD